MVCGILVRGHRTRSYTKRWVVEIKRNEHGGNHKVHTNKTKKKIIEVNKT